MKPKRKPKPRVLNYPLRVVIKRDGSREWRDDMPKPLPKPRVRSVWIACRPGGIGSTMFLSRKSCLEYIGLFNFYGRWKPVRFVEATKGRK